MAKIPNWQHPAASAMCVIQTRVSVLICETAAILAMFLLLSACYWGPATQPKITPVEADNGRRTISVSTQEPEIVSGINVELATWSPSDFLRVQAGRRLSKWFVPLTKVPNLTSRGRVGAGVFLGRTQVTWALDIDTDGNYEVYLDKAMTGDLSQQGPIKMVRHGARWSTDISAEGVTAAGNTTTVRFRLVIERGRTYTTYETVRTAMVQLGGSRVRLGVSGVWGYYGLPESKIYVDQNDDGEFDDHVAYREHVIQLPHGRYNVSIDETGSLIVLHATERRATQRAMDGEVLSPITITDAMAKHITLPHRGRVTVLAFGSSHCPPCMKELPTIEAWLGTAAGIDLLWVTLDSVSDVRSFVTAHSVQWPVIADDAENGVLHTMFDVDEYPSFAVIDAEGIVLCRKCALQKAMQTASSAVVH